MRPKLPWKITLLSPALRDQGPGAGRARAADPRGERGQGFLELGISLVFLLFLLSFLVDLGYAFYTIMAMRDAAQEAASYGAICPVTDNNKTFNTDLIRARLRLSATAPLDMSDILPEDISVEFQDAYGAAITPYTEADTGFPPVLGGSVVVTFTINHEIRVPFLGAIIGRYDYPLTVTVADTILRSKWFVKCDY